MSIHRRAGESSTLADWKCERKESAVFREESRSAHLHSLNRREFELLLCQLAFSGKSGGRFSQLWKNFLCSAASHCLRLCMLSACCLRRSASCRDRLEPPRRSLDAGHSSRKPTFVAVFSNEESGACVSSEQTPTLGEAEKSLRSRQALSSERLLHACMHSFCGVCLAEGTGARSSCLLPVIIACEARLARRHAETLLLQVNRLLAEGARLHSLPPGEIHEERILVAFCPGTSAHQRRLLRLWFSGLALVEARSSDGTLRRLASLRNVTSSRLFWPLFSGFTLPLPLTP